MIGMEGRDGQCQRIQMLNQLVVVQEGNARNPSDEEERKRMIYSLAIYPVVQDPFKSRGSLRSTEVLAQAR